MEPAPQNGFSPQACWSSRVWQAEKSLGCEGWKNVHWPMKNPGEVAVFKKGRVAGQVAGRTSRGSGKNVDQ